MRPRPHWLKENCLIYIPDVLLRSYMASAVFPAMLHLGTAGKFSMSFHANRESWRGSVFFLTQFKISTQVNKEYDEIALTVNLGL